MHPHRQACAEEGRPRGRLRPRCITPLTWAERDGASNSSNCASCTTASEKKNPLPSPPHPPHIPLRQKGRRLETSFLSSGQCDGNSKGGAAAEAASAPRGCGALASSKELRAAPSFLPLSQPGAEPHAAARPVRQNQNYLFAPKDQPRNANLLPRSGGVAVGTASTFTRGPPQAQRPGLGFNPKSTGSQRRSPCTVLQRGWKPEPLQQAGTPR